MESDKGQTDLESTIIRFGTADKQNYERKTPGRRGEEDPEDGGAGRHQLSTISARESTTLSDPKANQSLIPPLLLIGTGFLG